MPPGKGTPRTPMAPVALSMMFETLKLTQELSISRFEALTAANVASQEDASDKLLTLGKAIAAGYTETTARIVAVHLDTNVRIAASQVEEMPRTKRKLTPEFS